jgi:hypothetical protein
VRRARPPVEDAEPVFSAFSAVSGAGSFDEAAMALDITTC